MAQLPPALDRPAHIGGVEVPNRRAVVATSPAGAIDLARSGAGLVIARPFAGPLGPWLNDEPTDAWRESVDRIHSETPSLVMAQLAVGRGAGPDPLIFAARRLAAVGFDLLEFAPSLALAAAVPSMLNALRLAWKAPLGLHLPALPEEHQQARARAMAEHAVAGGAALLSADAHAPRAGAGNAPALAALATLRADLGVVAMAYCSPSHYETCVALVARGDLDLAALREE